MRFAKCAHACCLECAKILQERYREKLLDEGENPKKAKSKAPPCPVCGAAESVVVCEKPGAEGGGAARPGGGRTKAGKNAEAGAGKRIVPSAKMSALLTELRADERSSRKVLVFSQWTCFLALLRQYLAQESRGAQRGAPAAGASRGAGQSTSWEANDQIRVLDGSMNLAQRQRCVDWLNDDEVGADGRKKFKVLLISLKAGGTGLNLVAACRVYLMGLLRRGAKGSKIRRKMGTKWDSRDGEMCIDLQLVDVICPCSEGWEGV